jgi:hypothetical protein
VAAKTYKRSTAKKSPAYAKQIANDIHELLTQTVSQLVTSDAWPKMLAAMVQKNGTELSRFSFNNMLLVLAQCPEASAVITSKQWALRGRFPLKGSKALRVITPVKVKDERDPERTKVVGFRLQAEFDVSQTGPMWQDPKHNTMTITPALPRPKSVVKQLEGDAPVEMWDDLVWEVGNLGYSVEIGNTGDAMGLTDPKNKIVLISHRASQAQSAKTLAHELGHIMADHVSDLAEYAQHRGFAETVAESFSYMVCQLYGMDSALYSAPYIGTWAGKEAEKVEKAVQDCGKQVLAMFRTFLASQGGPKAATEELSAV